MNVRYNEALIENYVTSIESCNGYVTIANQLSKRG